MSSYDRHLTRTLVLVFFNRHAVLLLKYSLLEIQNKSLYNVPFILQDILNVFCVHFADFPVNFEQIGTKMYAGIICLKIP